MSSAEIKRLSAPSGNRDSDRWQASCPCGWSGAPHSNRTIEGRRLATRDAEQHRCRPLCRDCHGWGTVTITNPGGTIHTEDCRRCAGTGEEIR